MALFKKKPLTIEAMQIGIDAWPSTFWQAVCDNRITLHRCTEPDGFALIETSQGQIRGNNRDWLIKGVDGEFYPCRPEVFRQVYGTF